MGRYKTRKKGARGSGNVQVIQGGMSHGGRKAGRTHHPNPNQSKTSKGGGKGRQCTNCKPQRGRQVRKGKARAWGRWGRQRRYRRAQGQAYTKGGVGKGMGKVNVWGSTGR